MIYNGEIEMAKEILINQLFAGKYLNEGENIGHEVINLFCDDEGNNNLFITSNGVVKGHDLEHILFVRNVSARRTVEVVGLASGIFCITQDEMDAVRYAGASLNQIFSTNKYRGDVDTFSKHITFRANKFFFPTRRIIITIDEVHDSEEYTYYLNSERKVITPQGMREYYSQENDPEAYAGLKKLIGKRSLWRERDESEKLIPDGNVQNRGPSFLEIIRKEDDENIFSNLLSYYFEYSPSAFKRFAEDPKLLNIPDMDSPFEAYRETKERVDIWIASEKHIIVIENKIKSGINGVVEDDYSQLNKYQEIAEKEAKKDNKKAHYYIFAPDYARFDLSQFRLKKEYKVIRYSEIYRFFLEETETYIADRAFPDFLRGLKRHTLTLAELQFETMRSRLLSKINLLQKM